MKRLIVQYTWILGVAAGLLVLLLLTGCNQAPFTNKPLQESLAKEKPADQGSGEQGIPDFNGIAHAIGCVFAPDKCNKQ